MLWGWEGGLEVTLEFSQLKEKGSIGACVAGFWILDVPTTGRRGWFVSAETQRRVVRTLLLVQSAEESN